MALRAPRISGEDRERLCASIIAADSPEAADRVLAAVWAKLDGDMQDRITALIYAAQGAVDSKGRTLGGVERALADLDGVEVAATVTKRLKEGPWQGRPKPDDRPPGLTPDQLEGSPPPMRTPTREEVEEARATRPQLAEWGVAWPPPKGWRKRLLAQADAARARERSE